MMDKLSQANMRTAANVLKGEPVMLEGEHYRGRYFTLPDAPGKLLRAYDADTTAFERCKEVGDLIRQMEEVWEIPTVHPQFILTGREQFPAEKYLNFPAEMTALSISDKIEDAVDWKDALAQAASDPDIALEFDALNLKLAGVVNSIYWDGGMALDELMHIHQYVYSPGAPKTDRLILVDIEPFRTHFVPSLDSEATNESSRGQLMAIMPLIENLRHIEHATQTPSHSRDVIETMFEKVPAVGDDMEEFRWLLEEMLDTPIGTEHQERAYMDRMFAVLFEW